MSSLIGFRKPEAEFTTQSSPVRLELTTPAVHRNAAEHFRRYFAAFEVTADFATIILAVTLGYFIYYGLELGKHIYYPAKAVLGVAFGLAVIIILMLDRVGAYARGNSLLRVRETEQVVRVSAQSFLVAFSISFFASFLFSRWLLVIILSLVPCFCSSKKI